MTSPSRTVRVRFDGTAAGLAVASKQAEQHLERFRVQADSVDRGLTKLFTSGTKATLALGSVGGSTATVLGLATSLATASGAALVLPGAVLAGAAAVTVLKLATSGFGAAVSAADPAAFAEATKEMGANAVATAVAVREQRGAVVELRKEVQDRFFAGFNDDVRLLGSTYLPVLRPQLAGIAGEYNLMGREAVKALLAPSSVNAVNTVLGDTRGILGDMRPVLGNVLTGVLAIGSEGTAEFRGFGAAVTDVSVRFREWATQAAETGRITELIRAGKEELGDYGETAQNVGSIVGTVFEQLSAGGFDFSQSLVESTQALEDFLDTAEGQQALQALGETLNVTAEVARTVFLAVMRELAPVIIEAAPAAQEFARVVGVLLVDAVRTVGPLLQGLARFISENSDAIGVLVPILAGLVLGFKALSIIQTVAGFIGTAATALGRFGLAAGPLGLILGGAAIAVAALTSEQNAAARAAADHESAVTGLKGTLDEFNGSVTEATRSLIADDFASRTLADGKTRLADALAGAGVAFADYVAAAAGDEQALARVNTQLEIQAARLPEVQRQYESGNGILARYGISLNEFAGYALRGSEGIRELNLRLIEQGATFQFTTDGAGAATGQLGELGVTLGETSARLRDAQEQTRLAAEASGALAGQLAGVKAAMDAVPGQKEVVIESTSQQVIEQLRQLGFEVTELKDGRVRINLEDEEARRRFDAFLTTLNTTSAAPVLDLNTATAEEKGFAFEQFINGLTGIATADANVEPGTQKANGLQAHIEAITAIMTADANIAPGTAKGDELQQHISSLVAIMTADADNAPGTAKGDALRAYIDGLLGIMEADANTQPGTTSGNRLRDYINALRAAITANANTANAEAAINHAARPRTTFIDVIQRFVNSARVGAGGGLVGFSGGGVLRMARGGVIAGYAPGRDTIPAILSPGEAVLVPELVRAIGAKNILAANYAASGRLPTFWPGFGTARFAAGGIAEARSYLTAGITANTPLGERRTASSADSQADRPVQITIPIQIGDEVVRVVRAEITDSSRSTSRDVLAGAGVTY